MNRIVIGADVGATNVRAAAFDSSLRRLDYASVCISGLRYFEIIDVLEHAIGRVLSQLPHCEAIGLSMAGYVDAGTISHHEVGAPRGVPQTHAVCKRFSRRFRVPVYLENDGVAACVAELSRGAARRAKNVVSLTFGTFIGSCLVRQGEIVSRPTSGAGIGNVVVPHAGGDMPACLVGGGWGIGDVGSKRLGTKVSAATLAKLAYAGHHQARDVFRDAGETLGHLMSCAVRAYNPELIVLSGTVMKDARLLLPAAMEVMRESGVSSPVALARFGANAGITGAAVTALERGPFAERSCLIA